MTKFIVTFTDGTRAPDLYAINYAIAVAEADRYARDHGKKLKSVVTA